MTSSAGVGARLRGATVLRRARRSTSAPVRPTSTVTRLQGFATDPFARLELTIAALADAALADVLTGVHAPVDGNPAPGREPSTKPLVPATELVRASLTGGVRSDVGRRVDRGPGSAPVRAPASEVRRRGPTRGQVISGSPAASSSNHEGVSADTRGSVDDRSVGGATPTPAWTSRVIGAAASMPVHRAERLAVPESASPGALAGSTRAEASRSVLGHGGAGSASGPAASDPAATPSVPRDVSGPGALPIRSGAVDPRRVTASGPNQLASLARWWNDGHGPDEPFRAGDARAVASAQSPGTPAVPPGTSTTATSAGGPNASGTSSDLAPSASAMDRASFENSVSHVDDLRVAFGGLLEDVLLREARADGIEVRP